MTKRSEGRREHLERENEALRLRLSDLEADRDRLERERSELALRAEEAGAVAEAVRRQLTSVFERVTDAFVALDKDWRYTYVNARAGELFGRRPEELLGKHIWTEFPDGVGQPFHLAYERALAEQRIIHIEDYYAPWDRWFENVIYPSADGLSIYFHDITERKRIEEEQKLAQQRFADIVESLPDAAFVIDRAKRVVAWNEACERMTGVKKEALLGQGEHAYAEPFFGERRPILVDLLDSPRADVGGRFKYVEWHGDTVVAETFIPRLRGGAGAHVWGAAKPLLDRDGRRWGAIEVVRDVTERKLLEDAARESARQLQFVLDHVSDVIFSIAVEPDAVYRFSWVNRRFSTVTGLEEGQVVGALVQDVIPEPSRALVLERYAEAIRSGRPTSWEEESEYPGGRKFGQVTVVPVRDETGACKQLVGVVHDVTERKRAEEQIRALNEDLRREAEVLEQRVRSRTAQLAQRNQELKDFAYTVSHDLKAPLRGIAGYANELERKHRARLDDRAAFCLKQIRTATAHLDQLIEDLLHYSRLDAETPSATDVDLRSIVDAILRDRELLLEDLRVEVTLDVPAVRIRAWERGLVQVLSNLVDNAVKYSRRSQPPRLRIAAEQRDGAWRLSVADNGIGFDMKYHDRIFKLFNRLVRMEDYEGTGAGLAIAKKVLDKQGGRIWAASELGKGATFFVEIPTPQGSR